MFDLISSFNLKMQFLKRRLSGKSQPECNCYFGIALIILGIVFSTPIGFVALPPFAVVVLFLGVVGFVLLFTVIFAPLGLFLM